jgi:hypothetical protein
MLPAPHRTIRSIDPGKASLREAVTSAGPVDGKRRKELKELFAGCKADLIFVTAPPRRVGCQVHSKRRPALRWRRGLGAHG